jgi:hypothetical protein
LDIFYARLYNIPMAKFETPFEGFELWLPSELLYSARKAPYPNKIQRAARPPEDEQSIYGFLGQEWYHHHRARRKGFHYSPSHAKSAQLQAAKFAAGFFDKVALVEWLREGKPSEDDALVQLADETAREIIFEEPWMEYSFSPETLKSDLIRKTPFGRDVEDLMKWIVLSANTKGNEQKDAMVMAYDTAMYLGGAATSYYFQYAAEYLQPDQYELPASQLEV